MIHAVIPDIVREHVAQAAFQWSQHRLLSQAVPPDQAALAALRARLVANLDGALIADEAAWQIGLAQFADYPEPGELFVASHLAIASNVQQRIDRVLELAHQVPAARAGLAGALTWFTPQVSGPVVQQMQLSYSPVIRSVAIDVLAFHRADPKDRLPGWLADPAPVLRASACRLAAVLQRQDCAEIVARLAAAPDPEVRFAAATALAALGHPQAVVALKAEARQGPHATEALRLLSQTAPPADFLQFLRALYDQAETRPLAVRGMGMTGDRRRLGWLIGEMAAPATAEAAGESFLELFPEASTAEGLFSDDEAVLGPAFAGLTALLPVAERVTAWATQAAARQHGA